MQLHLHQGVDSNSRLEGHPESATPSATHLSMEVTSLVSRMSQCSIDAVEVKRYNIFQSSKGLPSILKQSLIGLLITNPVLPTDERKEDVES